METTEQPQGQTSLRVEEGDKPEREKSFARRALLQAGWAIPVVTCFSIPTELGAASPHNDIPLHDDISFGGPHQDAIPHGDFVGAP